jgi:hypothetical protein
MDRAGQHDHIRSNTVPKATASAVAHHDRAWWRAKARRAGSDWPAMIALHFTIIAPLAAATRFLPTCDIRGAHPCINSSFCDQCRKADARLRAERRDPAKSIPQDWDRMSIDALWDALNCERQRPTPQATLEAIMYCVRTRGRKALHEPANIERLSRCDEAALVQIDARIARLKENGQ